MAKILLEVIKMTISDDRLFLQTSHRELEDSVDPVAMLEDDEPDALTHSTSWRWLDNRVILTFVQVFPDGYRLAPDILQIGSSYHDAASLPPIECHAVRHLYFLLHTDAKIAVTPQLENFWDFAHKVVDIHEPAVAGFVGINQH
ncbi:MAG: hypothetical protein ACKOXI_02070 [Candidatus Planktophila sp.]